MSSLFFYKKDKKEIKLIFINYFYYLSFFKINKYILSKIIFFLLF